MALYFPHNDSRIPLHYIPSHYIEFNKASLHSEHLEVSHCSCAHIDLFDLDSALLLLNLPQIKLPSHICKNGAYPGCSRVDPLFTPLQSVLGTVFSWVMLK